MARRDEPELVEQGQPIHREHPDLGRGLDRDHPGNPAAGADFASAGAALLGQGRTRPDQVARRGGRAACAQAAPETRPAAADARDRRLLQASRHDARPQPDRARVPADHGARAGRRAARGVGGQSSVWMDRRPRGARPMAGAARALRGADHALYRHGVRPHAAASACGVGRRLPALRRDRRPVLGRDRHLPGRERGPAGDPARGGRRPAYRGTATRPFGWRRCGRPACRFPTACC